MKARSYLFCALAEIAALIVMDLALYHLPEGWKRPAFAVAGLAVGWSIGGWLARWKLARIFEQVEAEQRERWRLLFAQGLTSKRLEEWLAAPDNRIFQTKGGGPTS